MSTAVMMPSQLHTQILRHVTSGSSRLHQ